METSLTSRGYTVLKSELALEVIKDIREELTVSPKISKDYAFGPTPKYSLYLESESKFYLPKSFGLKKFGMPKQNKLPDSEKLDESINFNGVLREEQFEPVKKLLDACLDPSQMGGILNVYCGGGKTTMALYVAVELGFKTLIVVHKDFLLEQWKERIKQFIPNSKIGLIKAKELDIVGKDIVIASLQSLSMKDYPKGTFSSFGTVIVDEVHHTSAEVFSKALSKICFTYTIGLTATVTRKDGLSKVFQWYLGKIVHKAQKRKDDAYFHVLEYYSEDSEYSDLPTICNGKLNMSRMINNICFFEPRNKFIVVNIKQVLTKEPKRKILLLSDRRDHLSILQKMLVLNGFDVGLYMGGMKQSVLTECASKQIILATYSIASEGYDQPGLDTLILASPKSDIVQSVGRILRDKAADRKHVPLVVDILDTFSIFNNQGKKRIDYYEKCSWQQYK